LADEVGILRFTDGVRRSWQHCEFFPKPVNIREFIQPPKMRDGEAWNRELRHFEQCKRDGEKFYSLADVLVEFRKRVESGKVKGHDEKAQKTLEAWAKMLKNSEEKYAAKMLEESDPNRPKTDFKTAHEILKQQADRLKAGKP